MKLCGACTFTQISSKNGRSRVNLVGPSTLADLWIRHFADSLQVSNALPEARRWLDFGSGAGFPGLVTAIKYAGDADARVHLIESDQPQMRLSANCHPRDIGACHHPLRQTRNDPAGFRRAHRCGQCPCLGAA